MSTCVLSVGGGGGGGGVVFPVLLSVTAAGRRTRRKAFRGIWPGGDRNTNQQMTHANITTTKTTDERGHVTDTYANKMHTHTDMHTHRCGKIRSDAVTQISKPCLLSRITSSYCHSQMKRSSEGQKRHVHPSKSKVSVLSL